MNRAAPTPLDNMGRPEPRLDGRAKVTGEARYGSDFGVNDPAYAFLVTSVIAKGKSHEKRNLAWIGGSTAGGALIGGLAGGGKGALIGSAVGAGGGTTAAYATGKKDVGFGVERRLTFRLTQAVAVKS